MILVADSGSTKCDWILIDENQNRETTYSMGFNPFFHDSNLVEQKLSENELFQKRRLEIDEVYFYGAGCSSQKRNDIIKQGLARVFENANHILVDHDLTGAALSTTHGKPGITCIIGTGSNSCYFDGEKVYEEVPALGYILGDEASGSYFGKIMLSEWLYHRMPADIAADFQDQYSLTKENIFEAVHSKPNPTVYLASIMQFAGHYKDHTYFRDMIYEGMSKFINIHVWCFEDFRDVPVHFVGSVAYYFKDILEDVARNHRFTVGNIERRPVDSLGDYHSKLKLTTK